MTTNLESINDIKVSQLTELDSKFSGQKSFYGKALVGINNGVRVLYSYLTPVALIADDKQIITNNEDLLSPTTMRHIHEFLKQFGSYDGSKSTLIKKFAGQI
jgi:hypothetical protein